jgi:hypothetical protein
MYAKKANPVKLCKYSCGSKRQGVVPGWEKACETRQTKGLTNLREGELEFKLGFIFYIKAAQ